jgi:hypothetical protein
MTRLTSDLIQGKIRVVSNSLGEISVEVDELCTNFVNSPNYRLRVRNARRDSSVLLTSDELREFLNLGSALVAATMGEQCK